MVPQFLIDLKDFISQPWPWWVGGLMIAFIMFVLIFFGKEFGISENFRTMCAADGAGDIAPFFKFERGSKGWNLLVAFWHQMNFQLMLAHYGMTRLLFMLLILHFFGQAAIASAGPTSPDFGR